MTENLPRILIVDDEPENLKALERTLRLKFSVVTHVSPKEALERLKKESFEVIVSDQRMPEMLGTDFLAQVGKKFPLMTRVILTSFTETKEILDAINRAEIYRYITKPWDNQELSSALLQAVNHHRLLKRNQELIEELEKKTKHLTLKEQELLSLNQNLESLVGQRTSELKEANELLSELAMTDPLTKILNRRAFFQKFNEEIERSKRYVHEIVVAMMDVDHFKPFNDMEGHLFGDEALRKIVQIFTSNIRKTDVLGRYGGEEFILMMPETKVENALEICERLRVGVESASFQGQTESAYLTISVGLAAYPRHGKTSEELVKSADHALYQAKEDGRNRIVVHEDTGKNESFFVSGRD